MTDIISRINVLLGYMLPIDNDEDLFSIFEVSNIKEFEKEKFEKDFYLTIILNRISKEIPEINFKGGTCLNKVYYPYFRLSEDLDFSISTENELVNTNGKREKFARNIREKIKILTNAMGRSLNDDKYHHKAAQGNKELMNKKHTYLKYVINYLSIYDQTKQTIKIELTYTDKQYFPSLSKHIKSIFIHPLTEETIFHDQTIQCLDLQEMATEKCRACLTRRKPAIRDFFDLRYLQSQGIDILANKEIIKAKCDEVSDRKRTLEDNYDELEKQIYSHLMPVTKDIVKFDFKKIYNSMIKLQKELF